MDQNNLKYQSGVIISELKTKKVKGKKMFKLLALLYKKTRRFFRGKEFKRIATFPPEEVLPHVLYGRRLQLLHREFQQEFKSPPTLAQWRLITHRKYRGHLIDMKSQKLRLFDQKGLYCVRCGAEGKYFALEKNRFDPAARYQLNLYALNDQGEEVLMTKDHTIPISKGGSRKSMKNLQPMCSNCNRDKADQLEEKEYAKRSEAL